VKEKPADVELDLVLLMLGSAQTLVG